MRTLALSLLLALALTGCGSKPSPSSGTAANPPATPAASGATTAPGGPGATTNTSASLQGRTAFAIDPSGSKATYSVREKFANRELPNDAVGSTNKVEGQIVLPPAAGDAAIRVDLRTLTSDQSRRDSRLHSQGLESDKYPYAEFKVEKMEGLDKLPPAGQTAQVKLIGQMTIHGTTQPFTFTGEASMDGKNLYLKVSNSFDMTTFKVEPPSILGMLTVDPGVKLQVEVRATPIGG